MAGRPGPQRRRGRAQWDAFRGGGVGDDARAPQNVAAFAQPVVSAFDTLRQDAQAAGFGTRPSTASGPRRPSAPTAPSPSPPALFSCGGTAAPLPPAATRGHHHHHGRRRRSPADRRVATPRVSPSHPFWRRSGAGAPKSGAGSRSRGRGGAWPSIRAPVAEEEAPACFRTISAGFGSPGGSDDDLAEWQTVAEYDQCLGALDGDHFVGGASAYSFEMTLPGGDRSLTIGGVSNVAVLPTHRRQGCSPACWPASSDDLAGEPGAGPSPPLNASESRIYRRFGHGLATDSVSVEIDTRHRVPERAPAGRCTSSPSRRPGRLPRVLRAVAPHPHGLAVTVRRLVGHRARPEEGLEGGGGPSTSSTGRRRRGRQLRQLPSPSARSTATSRAWSGCVS